MEFKNSLHEYLGNLLWLDPGELNATTALLTSDLLDSLDLVNLVAFVEERTGIAVDPGELSAENWDSIDRILAFIARKQTTSVA